MSSQEFAEKFFCATVNAQIISAQTASAGTVILLVLLELGWLLEEKKRIDASSAIYPFQSILMNISIHMVPYCFLTHIRELDFFATPAAVES